MTRLAGALLAALALAGGAAAQEEADPEVRRRAADLTEAAYAALYASDEDVAVAERDAVLEALARVERARQGGAPIDPAREAEVLRRVRETLRWELHHLDPAGYPEPGAPDAPLVERVHDLLRFARTDADLDAAPRPIGIGDAVEAPRREPDAGRAFVIDDDHEYYRRYWDELAPTGLDAWSILEAVELAVFPADEWAPWMDDAELDVAPGGRLLLHARPADHAAVTSLLTTLHRATDRRVAVTVRAYPLPAPEARRRLAADEPLGEPAWTCRSAGRDGQYLSAADGAWRDVRSDVGLDRSRPAPRYQPVRATLRTGLVAEVRPVLDGAGETALLGLDVGLARLPAEPPTRSLTGGPTFALLRWSHARATLAPRVPLGAERVVATLSTPGGPTYAVTARADLLSPD